MYQILTVLVYLIRSERHLYRQRVKRINGVGGTHFKCSGLGYVLAILLTFFLFVILPQIRSQLARLRGVNALGFVY